MSACHFLHRRFLDRLGRLFLRRTIIDLLRRALLGRGGRHFAAVFRRLQYFVGLG